MMNRLPVRVSIVEDHDVLRKGLAMMLDSIEKYQVVSEYATCEEAIKNLHKDIPDIILMDIQLPGMSGIEGIEKIRKILPRVEIVVNTIHDDSEYVFEAIKAGASGYLTKGSDRMSLVSALDEILNGGAPMSSRIASMVVKSFQRNPVSPLSKRETEVLSRLAMGKSYQYIADELFVSVETIKSHVKRIYSKLHVKNKDEALEKATREKLI